MYALERPGDRLADHREPTQYSGLSFADRHTAQDWLYTEANSLLACVRQTSDAGAVRRAVDLLWATKDLAESGANAKQYEAAAVAMRDLARSSDDARAEGRALITLTNARLAGGRFDQAERDAQRAMRLADAVGDPLPSCWAPNDLGIIALYQNRHAEGEAFLTRAIENFRADGNRPGEASALCNLSRIHLAMGHTTSAVALAQRGIGIYDELGHTLRGANGRYALGLALAQSGEHLEATEQLHTALDVFRDSRQRLWEGMTIFRLAEVDLAAAFPARAATKAEQALAVLRGIGGEWRRGNVLTVLGRALSEIGQPGRAHVCWREALDIYEAHGSTEADAVRELLATTLPT